LGQDVASAFEEEKRLGPDLEENCISAEISIS